MLDREKYEEGGEMEDNSKVIRGLLTALKTAESPKAAERIQEQLGQFDNEEVVDVLKSIEVESGTSKEEVNRSMFAEGGASMLSRYDEGGNVEKKEKLEKILQAGEDGADKAIVEIMKYIPGSEGPPKGLVDLLEPVLRKAGEVYRKNKKEDEKTKKAEGGSMLVAPEMAMPVDTFTPEEQANAESSQLPDDEMEEGYMDYVLGESLDDGEQEYLMGALESDPRLSEIFDKVVTTASEFSGAGEVEGPGTGVSDSIPARLSDGEFVVTEEATSEIGADNLQTMMDDAERKASGGEARSGFQLGGLLGTKDPEKKDLEDVGQLRSTDDKINQSMLMSNQVPSLRR